MKQLPAKAACLADTAEVPNPPSRGVLSLPLTGKNGRTVYRQRFPFSQRAAEIVAARIGFERIGRACREGARGGHRLPNVRRS